MFCYKANFKKYIKICVLLLFSYCEIIFASSLPNGETKEDSPYCVGIRCHNGVEFKPAPSPPAPALEPVPSPQVTFDDDAFGRYLNGDDAAGLILFECRRTGNTLTKPKKVEATESAAISSFEEELLNLAKDHVDRYLSDIYQKVSSMAMPAVTRPQPQEFWPNKRKRLVGYPKQHETYGIGLIVLPSITQGELALKKAGFEKVHSDLLEVAYEVPMFRNQVRYIVEKMLQLGCYDSKILKIAHDIAGLRRSVHHIFVSNLPDGYENNAEILQIALSLPFHIREFAKVCLKENLQKYSSAKILQTALNSPDYRQLALDITKSVIEVFDVQKYIDGSYGSDFDMGIFYLAYDIPECRSTVEAKIAKLLQQPLIDISYSTVKIIQVALDTKENRAEASEILMGWLLSEESAEPKVLRLALNYAVPRKYRGYKS